MASWYVGTLCSESMLMGEAYCSWQQVNYRRETNRTTWFLLVPHLEECSSGVAMNCEFNLFWELHRMFPILVVASLNLPQWAAARATTPMKSLFLFTLMCSIMCCCCWLMSKAFLWSHQTHPCFCSGSKSLWSLALVWRAGGNETVEHHHTANPLNVRLNLCILTTSNKGIQVVE